MKEETHKKGNLLPKISRPQLIFACVFVFLIIAASAGYWSLVRSCRFAAEASAYTAGRERSYFFGKSSCQGLKSVKKLSAEEIQKLPRDKDFEIVSKTESDDLEGILSKYFLSFNKYVANEGDARFVIYEVKCGVCTKK